MGVESGVEKILEAMDKGEQGGAGAHRHAGAEGARHRACWFIQLGYWARNGDDVLMTRDLIRDERPDDTASPWPIAPGTRFHERGARSSAPTDDGPTRRRRCSSAAPTPPSFTAACAPRCHEEALPGPTAPALDEVGASSRRTRRCHGRRSWRGPPRERGRGAPLTPAARGGRRRRRGVRRALRRVAERGGAAPGGAPRDAARSRRRVGARAGRGDGGGCGLARGRAAACCWTDASPPMVPSPARSSRTAWRRRRRKSGRRGDDALAAEREGRAAPLRRRLSNFRGAQLRLRPRTCRARAGAAPPPRRRRAAGALRPFPRASWSSSSCAATLRRRPPPRARGRGGAAGGTASRPLPRARARCARAFAPWFGCGGTRGIGVFVPQRGGAVDLAPSPLPRRAGGAGPRRGGHPSRASATTAFHWSGRTPRRRRREVPVSAVATQRAEALARFRASTASTARRRGAARAAPRSSSRSRTSTRAHRPRSGGCARAPTTPSSRACSRRWRGRRGGRCASSTWARGTAGSRIG